MDQSDLISGTALALALCGLGCLLLHATWNHRPTLRFQMRLFVCAFVLRFAFSIVIYEFGLIDLLKDEDGSGWVVGLAQQQMWLQKGITSDDVSSIMSDALQGKQRGYPYLLGGFFYVTNTTTRIAAAALNCFLGALTAVFAYRIARSLFSAWVAVRVGWWTCLFPSMIIWSAQTIKEPVVILLETILLYVCIIFNISKFSFRHLFLCIAAVVLIVPFRFYAAYIAGASLATAFVLPYFRRGQLGTHPVLGIAAASVPLLMLSGFLARHQAQLDRYNLQYIERIRRYGAQTSGSGVETNYDLRTPEGLGLATATGAAHLLLAPFPWQLARGSSRMLLVGPEQVVWWWLVFTGLIPGLWYLLRSRFAAVLPLVFFSFGLGLLYSLMFSNVGLVYRQRAQLLPWLFVFAMVGLEQRILRRRFEHASTELERPPARRLRT